MKTALLHYWLTNVRGGEKVFAALTGMFPDADIFTHAYLPKMIPGYERRRVGESFIASLPFGRRHPQVYLPLMPLASRSLDLDAYDLIISSESGPIKGIRKPARARHVCYCHSPMRYVWDLYDEYYRAAGCGGKLAMRLFTPYLRRADRASADCVDEFIANSNFVAERIRRIYQREAHVVYPPVDVDFFSAASTKPSDRASTEEPYYLFVGAQVAYKRLDLAEAVCARMGRRLVVAKGVSAECLRELYAGARALLFPGIEDFGIVPVEAQAAGTPVIAFGMGGACETVVEGETGMFFHEPTVESLAAAIESFESRTWSADACRAQAARFSEDVFRREMNRLLNYDIIRD